METFLKVYIINLILSSCLMFSNGKGIFNVSTTQMHKNLEIFNTINSSNESNEEFILKSIEVAQSDQPAFLRTSFGHKQIEPTSPEKFEGKKQGDNLPSNLQFTKEILIKQGRIKGYIRSMHSQTGLKNVRQYLGIPYAAAPVGNGRFMPPGAPPPWTGLKMAIELPPVCPQNLPNLNHLTTGRYNQLKRLLRYLQNESEDCLFLNLYVPEWSGIGPRPIYPVMIFIHGESYEWNSGNAYDGSVLSSYGQVIVVTVNYRLGILGFLKPGTTDHTASNFGLLDQIAALQWVKDNIAAFGGDVGSVTLLGHTTGAACVNLLMLSPVAQGLFHRAILMSGSAMSDWAVSNHPLQATMQVLNKLDCPMRDDNEEMLTCLRQKKYQDILKVQVASPEFTTVFGPVVDQTIVPKEPEKMMQYFPGGFNRYDLLFGITEIESFNNLNAVGIMHGLLESERDSYLRFYMQNRFEMRPEIAMDLTLREYSNIYTNPKKALPEENRDVVLEVLSDARVVAPVLQTGVYHARVNPSTYMYLFSHISKAGDYPNLMQSITGEELPYVFGAPLASTRPFPNSFSPVERLLSEEIMVYWTNFAKTGNPKAPARDSFIHMDPSNWEQYDIDWPPFGQNNYNYLNIGIPPVVSKNYRQQYMSFWNQNIGERLSGDQQPVHTTSERPQYNNTTAFSKPMVPHVNYYLDKTTENPIRQLQYLLHRAVPNRSDMYQTQSTVETPRITDQVSTSPENTDNNKVVVLGDNKIVVKADSTLNVLIAIFIIFLVINVIVITVYVVRRNYFKKNLKRKLDVLSIDGTTDEELKRSNKFNDGDESLILDIVRRKNEYVPVKRYHSPINGFLLSRNYSTSTVDTHTKVSDWITQEVNRQSPNFRSKSPSFLNLFNGKKSDKINGDISGILGTHGDIIRRQEPVELIKSHSCEIKAGDCQNLSNMNLSNGKIESFQRNNIPQKDLKESILNPVAVSYPDEKTSHEQITSFIDNIDVNVTSRDECDGASHFPLSPEETLQIIQMRNYPKVLPKYPNMSSEYVSSSSFKRRSMPSYQLLSHSYVRIPPPIPPPRSSSTLDRKSSIKRSDSNTCEPIPTMATDYTDSSTSMIDEEPEMAYNALHVGPLLPRGGKEHLYSTVNRKKQTLVDTTNKPCVVEAQIETGLAACGESHLSGQTLPSQEQDYSKKINANEGEILVLKETESELNAKLAPENSPLKTDQHHNSQTPVLYTPSKIPLSILKLRSCANSSINNNSSINSSDSSSSNSSNDNTNRGISSYEESPSAYNINTQSTASSTETTSSDETVKHIF